MTAALSIAAVLAFAAICVYVVVGARHGTFGPRALIALAVACGVSLVVVVITDWPLGSLAEFWADHAIVSALVTSLLLVGAGFLAFEARENVVQSRLSDSLTSTAQAGLVDHLIDVDIALTLAAASDPPPYEGWDQPTRPLRWLRPVRENLAVAAHVASEGLDPRLWTGVDLRAGEREWRILLVDQSVRRVMAGMRDWAPVLRGARSGLEVLVRLGELRLALLSLESRLRSGELDCAREELLDLRARVELMALQMEVESMVKVARPELLTSPAPALADRADLRRAMADLAANLEAAAPMRRSTSPSSQAEDRRARP
jgi:hypothetical protein